MLNTYYIDYYDMSDGWLGLEYVVKCRKEWLFDDYDKAIACQQALEDKLAIGNVRCGEYYEVRRVE